MYYTHTNKKTTCFRLSVPPDEITTSRTNNPTFKKSHNHTPQWKLCDMTQNVIQIATMVDSDERVFCWGVTYLTKWTSFQIQVEGFWSSFDVAQFSGEIWLFLVTQICFTPKGHVCFFPSVIVARVDTHLLVTCEARTYKSKSVTIWSMKIKGTQLDRQSTTYQCGSSKHTICTSCGTNNLACHPDFQSLHTTWQSNLHNLQFHFRQVWKLNFQV